MTTTANTMKEAIQKVFGEFKPIRDNLIPILQEVQETLGYISDEAMTHVASFLKMSESEIYGVATFYTQFVFKRPGDHTVKACLGTACHVKRGQQIMDEISKYLNIRPGEITPDYKFGLESVACLGSCALAPVVVIDGNVSGRMNTQKVKKLLKDIQ